MTYWKLQLNITPHVTYQFLLVMKVVPNAMQVLGSITLHLN